MPRPKVRTHEEIPKKSEGLISRSHVYVEKSYTAKIANDDYTKITIGVTLPVDPTKEEIAAAVKTAHIAYKNVDEILLEKLDEALYGDSE